MKAAPLYGDTFAFCAVLLEELEAGGTHRALRRHLATAGLQLLSHVTLALGGFDRLASLTAADAELCALRTELRLAAELGAVTEESFLALAEKADAIGRQIGGWLKKLE